MRLILIILSLAFIDSFNPTTIAFHLFLLSKSKSFIRDSIFYINGIFFTYYIGGLIILLGFDKIIVPFFDNLLKRYYFLSSSLELLLGLLFLYLAYDGYKDYKSGEDVDFSVKVFSPISLFSIGFFMTLSDLPTALPYFSAIAKLSSNNLSLSLSLFYMFLYNLVYLLPLFLIIFVYIFFKDKILSNLQSFVNRFNNTVYILMIIFFVLLGFYLILDSFSLFNS